MSSQQDSPKSGDSGSPSHPIEESGWQVRVKHWLIGPPRDLQDRSFFRLWSLIPFLAWVGLGADGLSPSCYGPAEAFPALGELRYLAVGLPLATLATVLIISAGNG